MDDNDNNTTTLEFEGRGLHAFQRHGSKLPWFVLAEVCEVLGIEDHRVAGRRLDEDEKGEYTVPSLGGPQRTLVVSLSGLTRLAATSRKPIAKRFNKWLHSDVVVSIFVTGEFVGDAAPLDDLVRTFQPTLPLEMPLLNTTALHDVDEDALAQLTMEERRQWLATLPLFVDAFAHSEAWGRREAWQVNDDNGPPYDVTLRRNADGEPWLLRILCRRGEMPSGDHRRHFLPWESKQVLICTAYETPKIIVKLACAKVPGLLTPMNELIVDQLWDPLAR